MKKIFITAIIILTTFVVLIFTFRFTQSEWEAKLVSPGFPLGVAVQKSGPVPSSSPNIKTPKGFQFDESTDLKAELEKVNPQVLDSDFQ